MSQGVMQVGYVSRTSGMYGHPEQEKYDWVYKWDAQCHVKQVGYVSRDRWDVFLMTS